VECRACARPLNKPTPRAELSGFFDDLAQCELFYLRGKLWSLLLGEATRFEIVALLRTKSGYHLVRFVMRLVSLLRPDEFLSWTKKDESKVCKVENGWRTWASPGD
jgi:hypothetical protein